MTTRNVGYDPAIIPEDINVAIVIDVLLNPAVKMGLLQLAEC